MTKPKGLGRGLDALLGGAPSPVPKVISTQDAPQHPDHLREFPTTSAVREVAVADIEAHPGQPRRVFDEKGIKELADSIANHGIIQPITLRRLRASKFQIISGERRFRAAQMAGLTSLPAYVREADDQSVLEMALVENIQREDLNALEVALSFQQLMSLNDWTQDTLAKRLGKGRSTITNHLRVLDLPDGVQALIRTNALSLGHAKALAGLRGNDAPHLQLAMAEKCIAQEASVRELESWIQKGWPAKATKRPAANDISVDEEQALDVLRLKLNGTQAKLKLTRKGQRGGQITLSYADLDDLEAILEKLGIH